MGPFIPVCPPRRYSSRSEPLRGRQTAETNERGAKENHSWLLSLASFWLSLCLFTSHRLHLPPLLSPSHKKQAHSSFPDFALSHSWRSVWDFVQWPSFVSGPPSRLCWRDIGPQASMRWTVMWWWTGVRHFAIMTTPLRPCMSSVCFSCSHFMSVRLCLSYRFTGCNILRTAEKDNTPHNRISDIVITSYSNL